MKDFDFNLDIACERLRQAMRNKSAVERRLNRDKACEKMWEDFRRYHRKPIVTLCPIK